MLISRIGATVIGSVFLYIVVDRYPLISPAVFDDKASLLLQQCVLAQNILADSAASQDSRLHLGLFVHSLTAIWLIFIAEPHVGLRPPHHRCDRLWVGQAQDWVDAYGFYFEAIGHVSAHDVQEVDMPADDGVASALNAKHLP